MRVQCVNQDAFTSVEKEGNWVQKIKNMIRRRNCAKADYENMSYTQIREDLLSRVKNGHLCISPGLSQIPDRMFDGHRMYDKMDELSSLVSVHIPGTVKRIGVRAFAECRNLEKMTLEEGVECIEKNAFTGCKKLKSIRLPASVRRIDGWSFYGSGIESPVFSRDGKTLYYYPQEWSYEEYSVPEGVETIGNRAFIYQRTLKRIVLPKSLKRIESFAFIDCGFDEIMIPKGAEVKTGALWSFKHPVRIHFSDEMDAFSERRAWLNCFGASFLASCRAELPKTEYWKEESFLALSSQCAAGNVSAMEEMAEFFEKKSLETDSVFFTAAMNFWKMRAYLYGSKEQERYWILWCEQHPDLRANAPYLDEDLHGSATGKQLNALGFTFFKEDRDYYLEGVDDEGVNEVSSWESDEGPDEDGYGREEYYDWWYLNEFLLRPEGVDWVHSWSHREKQNSEETFRKIHDQAARAGAIKRKVF